MNGLNIVKLDIFIAKFALKWPCFAQIGSNKDQNVHLGMPSLIRHKLENINSLATMHIQ